MAAQKQHRDHLGFAPPLLGMQPLRLPVLFDDGELIALMKPAGILVLEDNWFPRTPVLVEAIRYEAARRKQELVDLNVGACGLWAVYDLDPECAGPVLFTRTKERAEELRNDLGSLRFTFGFEGVSRGSSFEGQLVCDLPLARHREEKRMVVSHKAGKQCSTTYYTGNLFGNFRFWSAETHLSRRHQILLHALESSLPVLGDQRYAGLAPLCLSRIKKGFRPKADRQENPLYPGPAYRLRVVRIPDGSEVYAPDDPKWEGMRRQLRRHCPAK
jgi:23S rRNA pseudouridine1911/1915/1917 synthase